MSSGVHSHGRIGLLNPTWRRILPVTTIDQQICRVCHLFAIHSQFNSLDYTKSTVAFQKECSRATRRFTAIGQSVLFSHSCLKSSHENEMVVRLTNQKRCGCRHDIGLVGTAGVL